MSSLLIWMSMVKTAQAWLAKQYFSTMSRFPNEPGENVSGEKLFL